MTDYQPPELTDEERRTLKVDYLRWVRTNGFHNVPCLIDRLIVDNAVLVKESNELRTRLGINARPTYNLGSKK